VLAINNKEAKIICWFSIQPRKLNKPDSVARKIESSVDKIYLGLQKTMAVGNVNVVKKCMWTGSTVPVMVHLINQNNI
jgi:GDP-D-mannose dehydratase